MPALVNPAEIVLGALAAGRCCQKSTAGCRFPGRSECQCVLVLSVVGEGFYH